MGYNQSDLAPLDLLGFMPNAIETYPRTVDGGMTLVSGRLMVTYVTAYRTLPITQLGVHSRNTAVGTLTNWRQGLCVVAGDDSLLLVARTAQQTSGTFAAAFTEYIYSLDTTGGFPATYTLLKGQRYAFVGLCNFASTAPQLRAHHSNLPTSANTRGDRLNGTLGSQSDIPTTSIPVGTLGNDGNTLYQFALA